MDNNTLPEYKLIVAGGRDFTNYEILSHELMHLAMGLLNDHAVSIVSGMARGADMLAVQFAREHNVQLYKFPADWGNQGKRAGFIRNTEMARFSDGLLAFWDGKSRGTRHMIDTARERGLDITVVNY